MTDDQVNQIIAAIEKNTALLSALLGALADDDESDEQPVPTYLDGRPVVE